jgi:hypothetical protein
MATTLPPPATGIEVPAALCGHGRACGRQALGESGRGRDEHESAGEASRNSPVFRDGVGRIKELLVGFDAHTMVLASQVG